MLQASSEQGADTGPVYPYRAMVLGVGGGGCNAVSHMARSGVGGPAFVAVNTDVQALERCAPARAVPIGAKVTEGLGAGGDPGLGRLAAEDDREILRDTVFGMNLVVLVVGLGGGTGTGAAPVLAELAQDAGALTACFATLPFGFEGEKRTRQAEEGLKRLRDHCDIVVQLPNEYLVEQGQEQENLVDAFARADRQLGVAVQALWLLLSEAGVINLDLADLRQLAGHSGGMCSFAYGEGTGAWKADGAVRAILEHPELSHTRGLLRAGAFLVNIMGSPELALADVHKVMTTLKNAGRPDAHIYMGAAINPGWTDKLALTVLIPQAAGLAFDTAPEAAPEPEAAPIPEPVIHSGVVRAKPPRKRKPKVEQTSLNFEGTDKGRFRNVEPTIYEGEDLDIPTYVRRGVKLSFER